MSKYKKEKLNWKCSQTNGKIEDILNQTYVCTYLYKVVVGPPSTAEVIMGKQE